MPESTLSWIHFNQKKPYLLATAFSLVLVVFAAGFIFQKLAAINQGEVEKLEGQITPAQARMAKFKSELGARDAAHADADTVAGWIQNRYYWADVLSELHRILIQVEARKTADLNYPVGLWIERMVTDPDAAAAGTPGMEPTRPGRPGAAPPPGAVGSSIYLFCRGVDLTTTNTSGNLSANRDIANEFINELRDSKLFDNQAQAPDRIDPEPNGTFTFGITLKLKRPLKM